MQPPLKRAIIAFVLASIIIVSFASLLHQQKSFTFIVISASHYSDIPNLRAITTDPYCLLAMPKSFSVNVNATGQSPFNNGTRTQICDYIERAILESSSEEYAPA